MKIGDTVTWKSREYEPEKTGEIIAIIPAGESVSPHIPLSAKGGHIKVGGEKSIHERALVAVLTGKDRKIIHYYAPRLKVLLEQNENKN